MRGDQPETWHGAVCAQALNKTAACKHQVTALYIVENDPDVRFCKEQGNAVPAK